MMESQAASVPTRTTTTTTTTTSVRIVPPPAPPSATSSNADHTGGAHNDRGTNSGSDSQGKQKAKRKRSMIACKNCNERRVRCDGATLGWVCCYIQYGLDISMMIQAQLPGLPCSNCKHAGKTDCQFIESRRVRGAHGRFESRDGVTSSSPRPPRRARRHSITGTSNAEWLSLLQNSAAIHRPTTGPVSYFGESWHLSWVVAQSDDKPLHLPTVMLEEDGEAFTRVKKKLWDEGHYTLPSAEILDLLVSQYFEIFHPWYPILCKRTFYESLRTNTFSHLLLQAVLMVAAIHCDAKLLSRAGFENRRSAVETFYTRTRGLFDGDVEPDKLTTIQTQFLLQFWWRAVTDHKDPSWWLGGAIRQAQSMGLHRSAKSSKLSEEDKRTWRRVWWMLYVRDRLSSSHHGRPMMVREEDCDVEPLTLPDLLDELTHVQAHYVISTVSLARLIAPIASCEFTPGAAADLQLRMRRRDSCHTQLRTWQSSLPAVLVYKPNSTNLYASYLQLTFLGQLLLLNRPALYTDPTLPPILRQQSMTIANHAAEAITKTTHDILRHFGARYLNGQHMSCFFSAMTTQLIDSRSPDPARADASAARLRENLEVTKHMDEILPMANWFRNRLVRTMEGRDEIDRSQPISPSPHVYLRVPVEQQQQQQQQGMQQMHAGQGAQQQGMVEGMEGGEELIDYQWFVDNIQPHGGMQGGEVMAEDQEEEVQTIGVGMGGPEGFWWVPTDEAEDDGQGRM